MKPLFYLTPLVIVFAGLSPGVSLVVGLTFGILFRNPSPERTATITKYLLQFAIIGLGFGMDFQKVVEAGREGFLYTLVTIACVLCAGYVLGRLLKVERKISCLISVGTAICGGSAIAAVSQILDSDENDISVSIGTVFILNAVALLIFPAIGDFFHLSQRNFGMWAAIAIHDTSSVVGAASLFGDEALMVATTVKLARALWIVPLVLLTSLFLRRKSSLASFPWFILLFVAASLMRSYGGLPENVAQICVDVAKSAFSITLYLIGAGISLQAIRTVGVRPFLHGVLLWTFVLASSLCWLA